MIRNILKKFYQEVVTNAVVVKLAWKVFREFLG
jgi:hypothetical protein